MANIDAPFGLRPIAKNGQNPNNGGQTQYLVGGSQSTAIFTGDPVKPKNDGTVEVATASDALLGVFMGGFYTDPTTNKPTWNAYIPASLATTDAKAFVCDDPQQLFIAQQDSVGSELGTSSINLNANLTFGAGSTITGVSGVEIDSSTGATTATHQVRLLHFYDVPSNTIGESHSIFVIKINNHVMMAGTGTAGI